ncbi:MAG: maleate cis-trans isomerase [Actinomycetota bacterium]|nr:maleate cis-trans isomerase [Actinomycetota bacterium]
MSHTVGVLYPGYSAEDDFPAIERILGHDVRLPLAHTKMREDAHRVDALLDVGSRAVLAEGVQQLKATSPQAVVWACTSGSFVFGWAGAQSQVRHISSAAGVPASSTSFAFVEAARHLGLRRVSVAATYPCDVASHFVDFLQFAGVEVVHLASRGIVTAAEVGTMQGREVIKFAKANNHPHADAVLIPDTALHTVHWLNDLELSLEKPVLTANQVSAWMGLQLAGYKGRCERLGLLFRAPRASLTTAG